MATGRKTGGRTKGTPNKATSATAHIFANLGGADGATYAKELHALACDRGSDPNVKVKALNIIRDYLPWQKQADRLELAGSDGGPVRVEYVIVGG